MHALSVILRVLLAVLSVATVGFVMYEKRRKLKFVISIWSRFRILMFIEVCWVVLQTVMITLALMQCNPVFKYGWMNLFYAGGGNAGITPVTEAASSGIKLIRVLPFLFLAAVVVTMPFFVQDEERMFRKGRHKWSGIAKSSIAFGLVHCLVGIPLGAGIALIGVGLFFGCKYRGAFLAAMKKCGDERRAAREAVLVSTTYHTLYNTIFLVLLAVVVTITALN